jgi:hypothetical protein
LTTHTDRYDVSAEERQLITALLHAWLDSGTGGCLHIGTVGTVRIDTDAGLLHELIRLGDVGSEEALHRAIYILTHIKRAA